MPLVCDRSDSNASSHYHRRRLVVVAERNQSVVEMPLRWKGSRRIGRLIGVLPLVCVIPGRAPNAT